MTRALFLSASVPDVRRDPQYHRTADRIAIRDAIRALVTVAVPHFRLVAGGHPAITPLIRVVAEANDLLRDDHIRLYQSKYYKAKMPSDNAAFKFITLTPAARGLELSLLKMRQEMIASERYYAGIFIGGMEGVEEEFEMFRDMHPKAKVFPVASTGAAAAKLFHRHPDGFPSALLDDLAYPSLFRRLLLDHGKAG